MILLYFEIGKINRYMNEKVTESIDDNCWRLLFVEFCIEIFALLKD
jgi:hypothetical protein